jgi:hypothetical protein
MIQNSDAKWTYQWFKEGGEKIGDDLAKSLQSKLGHQNL